jgi:phosphoglycolate phosphatase
VRDFSGMKMDDIFSQYFGFVPKEKLKNLKEFMLIKRANILKNLAVNYFPKVKETLEKLAQDYRLFIVSNCMKGYIENFIGFFSFEGLFEDFECFGNYGLPKDKNIRLIVERNNFNPVYVGDTIWDKESSEKAGVDFIYAAYGFGKIEIQNSDSKFRRFNYIRILKIKALSMDKALIIRIVDDYLNSIGNLTCVLSQPAYKSAPILSVQKSQKNIRSGEDVFQPEH